MTSFIHKLLWETAFKFLFVRFASNYNVKLSIIFYIFKFTILFEFVIKLI